MEKTGKVQISSLMIGMVMFTMFIMGSVGMLSILGDSNPDFLDDEKYVEFNKSFNKMGELTKTTDDLTSSFENPDDPPSWGVFGGLNALVKSAWHTIKALPGTLVFMINIFGGFSTIFGIPAWVGVLLGSIISIIIGFTIWSAIFQRDI